ncbi:LPD38 domain-containing protein [Aeromonas enteropelogenes]|uniref:LPD38 domain-containing protein n=1 Tax=Aeromonas enteropelogenes TaxID=29489 RepID=UPI003B9FD04B
MPSVEEFDSVLPRDLEYGPVDWLKGVGGSAVQAVGSLVSNASLRDFMDNPGDHESGVGRLGEAMGLNVPEINGNKITHPNPVSEAAGQLDDKLRPYAREVGTAIKDVGSSIIQSASPDLQEAMNNPDIYKDEHLGKGASDPAAYLGMAAQGVGSMVPNLAAGLVSRNPYVGAGAGAAMSIAQTGDQAYDSVMGLPPTDLQDSPMFMEEARKVEQNPESANLPPSEKFNIAQQRLAERVASMARFKPETFGAAALGTLMGDSTFLTSFLKGGSKQFLKGAARGALEEGLGEGAESGIQQRVGNQSANMAAGKEVVSPMEGVWDATANGAIGGALVGGPMGGISSKFAKAIEPNKDNITPEQAANIVAESMRKRGADEETTQQVVNETVQQVYGGSGKDNPLGPSSSQHDEVRDVPAYLRQDDTASRFKGVAKDSDVQRTLSGEFGPSVQELVQNQIQQGEQGKSLYERAQAGELGTDPFTGNKSAMDVAADSQRPALRAPTEQEREIDGYRRAAEAKQQEAIAQRDALRSATFDPGVESKFAAEASTNARDHAIQRAGSEADSIYGPLKSLRITRKGKPWASEKEAELASRKTETPVPLKGGGFGIAGRAEVEQARASQELSQEVSKSSGQEHATSGDQRAAVDAGVEARAALDKYPLQVRKMARQLYRSGQAPTDENIQAVLKENGATGKLPKVANEVKKAYPHVEAIDRATKAMTGGAQQAEPAKAKRSPPAKQHDEQTDTPATEAGVSASEPAQQIEAARAEVEPEPTEAQKDAGNYKKGHVKLHGMDITLENPKGSTRSDTDQGGKPWHSTMAHDYGYIKRTEGADGDHVDVFIGDQPESEQVYVVDQVDPKTGKFDEHKVMLGFPDEASAKAGYQANYQPGWKGMGAIKAMPMTDFKAWLKEGDTTKPITSNKIADFGEKIGGARKDVWEAYRDSIEGNTAEEIRELPLSKAWPAPDYQKLIDEGADPAAVALMRAARDAIPAKPRANYKVSGWANAVKSMRDLGMGLLDGSIDADVAGTKMEASHLRSASGIKNKADLYQAVGHQRSLADLELGSGSYSLYDGVKYDPPKSIWTISRANKSSAFGNWPRTIATGSNKTEAIAAFQSHYEQLTAQESKPKAVSFDIYSSDSRKSWIVGKKVGRNYLALTPPFESLSDARKYRDEHYDDLISKLDKAKEIPSERRDINQPRVGEDMRDGADVTPDMFSKAFGFRGVEFGNWVEQGRRQQDLNNAYDALMDMAAVIDVHPQALSLNGELGLAFGARGSGGVNAAAAHYEPGKVVINLTKKNGKGSLGHEWWHALDNYFSRRRGQAGGMMTEARDVSLAAGESQYVHQGDVRREMIDAFGTVRRAIKQTALKARSSKLDSKRAKAYWTAEPEMSARAFESYLIAKLQDQGASNDYLANIVSQETWDASAKLGMDLDDSYPYPTAGEVPGIRASFDRFFDTIEEKEENGRRILFSQQGGLSADEVAKIVSDFRREYKGARALDFIVGQTQEDLYGPEGSPERIGWNDGGYLPDKQQVHLFADSVVRRAGRQDIHERTGEKRGLSGRSILGHSLGDSPQNESDVGRTKRARAEVISTLRHEVLGHYGLDTFTSADKLALLQKLIDAKNEKWIAPVWQQIEGDSVYGKKSIEHQAEEVFAHIAEKELPSRSIQAWNDIKTMFSRLLRKVGLVRGPIKEHELNSLIRAVGDGIRSGERTRQNLRKDDGVIGKPAADLIKTGKPERIVNFSEQSVVQGTKPAKHLTKAEAELLTKQWFKQYKGTSDIDVQVHATQQQMEKALGLEPQEGLIRRAAFDDGANTLHIAADTISTPKRMHEILRHEVLAHYGLANVLGGMEYTNLMGKIIDSQHDKSMKPVWDWVKTHYAGEDVGTQAEEVIAHLAELEPSAWRRGWNKVMSWIMSALRNVGFVQDGITVAETRDLLSAIGEQLKRGPVTTEQQRSSGLRFSQSTTIKEAMKKLNIGPTPSAKEQFKEKWEQLQQTDRKEIKPWLDRVVKKANTELLDALAPVKYAEDAAGVNDARDSGYIAARMATGSASTMQATMLYGLPEWKDGAIQRKAGTDENDALMGIFNGLGKDLNDWLGWIAGHRAEMLQEQGRENLLTPEEIQGLKALNKGKEAKFDEAKKRWNRLNAATLDLAQEAGLLSAESRSEFENEWYIPFFRETESGDVLAPYRKRGIANQNAGIKKLKGGTANTNDLLDNIFTVTQKLIDSSLKNMAAQKTVWNLSDTGLIDVIAKPNKMDYEALHKPGGNRIKVRIDGEDYMLKVNDPELYRAMTYFDRNPPKGAFMTVATKAKQLLTSTVTSTPEFMLRNFIRDSMSAWAISKDGYTPFVDSIKGLKNTWKMDDSTINVMFSGASFVGGHANGEDPEASAKAVRKTLIRKGLSGTEADKHISSLLSIDGAKSKLEAAWEMYVKAGDSLENSNRNALYQGARKAGKSHIEAAFEAKDSMDFSMMGASSAVQVLSRILPFFNARLQGLGKLSRAARDNPQKILMRGSMIAVASLALLANNWDDERYDELPDWDKDAYWHLWIDGKHWRVPKPFEVGTFFGTLPERMIRAMGGKDTADQTMEAFTRMISSTLAMNPIPQVFRPIVESYTNYDFFKESPIENMVDLEMDAEARYDDKTSLLMRGVGETLGLSPKQLEHLFLGYTGTLGSYLMAATDAVIRTGQPGESPELRWDEIPVAKSFFRGEEAVKSTRYQEEFYQMLSDVNKLKHTVDKYNKEGRRDDAKTLLEQGGKILWSRKSLTGIQKQLRAVRNKIALIQRDRTLSAEEKRERIDKLYERGNDLVYQVVQRNRHYWE